MTLTAVITEQDITAANDRATLADTAFYAAMTQPNANQDQLVDLGQRARTARQHLEVLEVRRQAQLEQLVARDAAEKTAGKRLDGAVKRLRGQQTATAAAIGEAQAAVWAALTAVRAHDEVVAEVAAELRELGLTYVAGVDHDTAVSSSGRGHVVSIRGAVFRTLSDRTVWNWLSERVRWAVFAEWGVGRARTPLAVHAAGLDAKIPPMEETPRPRRVKARPVPSWPRMVRMRNVQTGAEGLVEMTEEDAVREGLARLARLDGRETQ